MSACISTHGEYGEHELDDRFRCTLCREVDVERLLTALDEARVECDKARRAAKTLGGIVEQNARMILDITGLHDWIDEDGDGDWGAVWDNAYELLPRIKTTEAQVERLHFDLDREARARQAAEGAPAAEVSGYVRIPKPEIHTGPKHMTVDQATVSYLRDAAARVRTRQIWGSGVSALVAKVLDDTAAALATPTTTDTTTEGDRA